MIKVTMLSALVLASPLLMLAQSQQVPTPPAQTRITVERITVNPEAPRSPGVISCVGNFGDHYNVRVSERFYDSLRAQDQAYIPSDDYRSFQSSGCGNDTVAPVSDESAFRK